MAGDTARAANTDEVKGLRREARDLKEVLAEQTLELRLLKKSMLAPSHRYCVSTAGQRVGTTTNEVYPLPVGFTQ